MGAPGRAVCFPVVDKRALLVLRRGSGRVKPPRCWCSFCYMDEPPADPRHAGMSYMVGPERAALREGAWMGP